MKRSQHRHVARRRLRKAQNHSFWNGQSLAYAPPWDGDDWVDVLDLDDDYDDDYDDHLVDADDYEGEVAA